MKKRQTKPSRHALLAAATAQDYAHDSSCDVTRRRATLSFEMGLNDSAIMELEAQIKIARARRAELAAMIEGLASVIGKRLS